MLKPNLRVVMNAEEYDRERQKLEDVYGEPDASSDVLVAKRDQAFAELFLASGWTQDELAQREGKGQTWVNYRLRLGRFLAYAANITIVITPLAETRFRSFWNRTDKNEVEITRFDAVIALMNAPPVPKSEAKRNGPPARKVEEARKIIRPILESGERVHQIDLAKELGVSEQTVKLADFQERGRLEGLREAAEFVTPLDTSSLSATAQERFDALERRLRARLAREFDDQMHKVVQRHIEEYLMPFYKERLEKADLLSQIGKPFDNAQYISLLRALHPDSSNAENRHTAFILLKEKEVLLRPEERDRPLSSGLPTTLAELLARKRNKAR